MNISLEVFLAEAIPAKMPYFNLARDSCFNRRDYFSAQLNSKSQCLPRLCLKELKSYQQINDLSMSEGNHKERSECECKKVWNDEDFFLRLDINTVTDA
jgi:hypothetical protein